MLILRKYQHLAMRETIKQARGILSPTLCDSCFTNSWKRGRRRTSLNVYFDNSSSIHDGDEFEMFLSKSIYFYIVAFDIS